MRDGTELPSRIANAPEQRPYLTVFMMAFMELQSTRYPGFNQPANVSWTSIDRWCESHGIVGELRYEVFYHVQALDVAYLKWLKSKKSANRDPIGNKGAAPKAPKPRRR